ncbi:MAG: FAD-dependent oxidoreductase [bacterium]|nr:FAD-dependent oxidoreductase [bacterium]
MKYHPITIIGAGVAGLTCAKMLQEYGLDTILLDKGRSVGGRCSTWRTDQGHRLDYGPTFFHGSNPFFLQTLQQLDGTIIDGWPYHIQGSGTPCQVNALQPHMRRIAIKEGISAFPKYLAQGLTIHSQQRITQLSGTLDGVLVTLESGDLFQTQLVVLALPNEQMCALLETIPSPSEDIKAIRYLLSQLVTFPSLTVLATYPKGIPIPEWDLLLPSKSPLQLIANESSKRPEVEGLALVLQAKPAWSAKHLEESPEQWQARLFDAAAPLIGEWVKQPQWSRAHRWRYARTDLANEWGSPILLTLGSGKLLLAGESFSRSIGVEGAFLSGIASAEQIRRMKQ